MIILLGAYEKDTIFEMSLGNCEKRREITYMKSLCEPLENKC